LAQLGLDGGSIAHRVRRWRFDAFEAIGDE
jgi:hypothetical protein